MVRAKAKAGRIVRANLCVASMPEANAQLRDFIALVHEGNSLKRYGHLLLNQVIVGHPRVAARLVNATYESTPRKVIGMGWHCLVIGIGQDAVLKIDNGSIELTRAERQAKLERERERHARLSEHLGGFVLPHQTTFIGPHPVLPSHQAIQTVQPFVEIVDQRLFKSDDSSTELATKVARLRSHEPLAAGHLIDVIDRSRQLYGDAGHLLPDFIGDGNFGVDNHNHDFLMVDGQPTGPDEPQIQRAILSGLDKLETAVYAAA